MHPLNLLVWSTLLLSPYMQFSSRHQVPVYTGIAQELLYAARTGEPTEAYVQQLAAADADTLFRQLATDDQRKAFWLNVYNAFVQCALRRNKDQYRRRSQFFSRKLMTIAGQPLSLDDVEHGILRRSRNKWSLGYVGKVFPSAFEKRFRIDRIDYRIHFALNCGARSCPPIAFYDPGKIEQQLELATRAYLGTEAEYNAATNTVHLPAIMSWFRGDFGGKKGIRQLLYRQGTVPKDAHPAIRFKKYDWSLYLDNFAGG